MYHTKDNGRNGYTFFAPSMNISAHQQLKLLNDLRRAVERNELCCTTSPSSPHPTTAWRRGGAAALATSGHGAAATGHIIAAAERSGLILSLGEWVLDEAVGSCADAAMGTMYPPSR